MPPDCLGNTSMAEGFNDPSGISGWCAHLSYMVQTAGQATELDKRQLAIVLCRSARGGCLAAFFYTGQAITTSVSRLQKTLFCSGVA
jgi:hypothetical protein